MFNQLVFRSTILKEYFTSEKINFIIMHRRCVSPRLVLIDAAHEPDFMNTVEALIVYLV